MNSNTRLQDVDHLIHMSFVHAVQVRYPAEESVFCVFYVAKDFLPSKKSKVYTRKRWNLHCIKYARIRENTDQRKLVFPQILFSDRIKRRTLQLTLSLSEPRWGGDNTDLPSDINISKTVEVSIAFIATFFKEYWISFLMISRLIDFALVVL